MWLRDRGALALEADCQLLRTARATLTFAAASQRAALDRNENPMTADFVLHIENFRVLRNVDWSPSGVCALVGPNGAGKTTLLQALEFMRQALVAGPRLAVQNAGGAAFLRNLQAAPSDPLVLSFETEKDKWEIRPVPLGAGLQAPLVEHYWHAGELVVARTASSVSVNVMGTEIPPSDESAFFSALEAKLPAFREPGLSFGKLVSHMRFHAPSLADLQRYGSQVTTDTELSSQGGNLFAVLRNWQAGERKHRERLDFVKKALSAAFPDGFEDMDFEAAGQTVTGRFYLPGGLETPVPIHLAPHGLLSALVTLAGVASAWEESCVAIDEIEAGLHPFAIRALVEQIRARAASKKLTVLLATHSPVVLNQFNGHPEQVFVIEEGRSPVALDKHRNPEWLAQFALGDLFANLDFGATKVP